MWNMSKVNNKDNKMKYWRRSGVFTVDFERTSIFFSEVPIVEFVQIKVCSDGL